MDLWVSNLQKVLKMNELGSSIRFTMPLQRHNSSIRLSWASSSRKNLPLLSIADDVRGTVIEGYHVKVIADDQTRIEVKKPKTSRFLVPSIIKVWPESLTLRSDIEHIFCINPAKFKVNKNVDICFSFDFGAVEITKLTLNSHFPATQDKDKDHVIAQLMLIPLTEFPSRELRDSIEKLREGEPIVNLLAKEKSVVDIINMDVTYVPKQKFKIPLSGTTAGRFFVLKLVLKSQGDYFETKISIHGTLRGLIKHVPIISPENADIINRSLITSGKSTGLKSLNSVSLQPTRRKQSLSIPLPSENEGEENKSDVDFTKTIPHQFITPPRPSVNIGKRVSLSSQASTPGRGPVSRCPGQGYLVTYFENKKFEETIKLEALEKIFLGYGFILSFLRIAEHSQVLKQILRFVVSVYRQHQPQEVPNLTNFEDFLKYLPENMFLTKQQYPEQYAYVRLDFMDLRGSKLVNQFVLKEWVDWGLVHSVDLSFTDVSDSDVFPLFTTCEKNLISIQFKGCKNLTMDTLHYISKCKKLQYLGMWDGDEELMFQLANMMSSQTLSRTSKEFDVSSIPYLDLSYCKNISSRMLEVLSGQRYVDFSYANGSGFEKRTLQKWAKNNKTMQGLSFRQDSESKAPAKGFPDDYLFEILKECPLLRYLDLINCRELADEVPLLKNLAKWCPKLLVLKLNCCQPDPTQSNNKGEFYKQLVLNLKELQQIEIIKKGSATIDNLDLFAEGLMSCENLTSLTLRLKSIDGAGFANLIKRLGEINKITKLDLQDVKDSVACNIKYCLNLLELHLQGADIQEKTVNDIVSSCRQLSVVSFLGLSITDTTMQILLFHRSHSLHTLILDSCSKLTSRVFDWLCERHTDLRILTLCACNWVTQESLRKLVTSCKRIQYLDISKTLIKQSLLQTDESKELAAGIINELRYKLPNAIIISDLSIKTRKK